MESLIHYGQCNPPTGATQDNRAMPNPKSARLAARQRTVISYLVDRFPLLPEEVKQRFPAMRVYEAETEVWRQRLQLKLGELTPEEVEDLVEEGDDFLKRSGGSMLGFLTLFADPTDPLHAVTKQYVDAATAALTQYVNENIVESDQKVFEFLAPTNPWPLPHGKGKSPGSCRVLVRLPSSTTLFETIGLVTDLDANTSQVEFGANYGGKAILTF